MIASKLANSLEFRCLGTRIQMNPKPTLSFNPTTHSTPIFSSIQLHIVNPPPPHTTLKTRIFSSIQLLHIVNPTTLNTHFLFLFNYNTCQPHNTQHTFSLSIQLQKSWTHTTHTHTHTHSLSLSLSLSHTHTTPKKNTQHKQPFFSPHL
jgi:hypothetical protein